MPHLTASFLSGIRHIGCFPLRHPVFGPNGRAASATRSYQQPHFGDYSVNLADAEITTAKPCGFIIAHSALTPGVRPVAKAADIVAVIARAR